MELGAIEQDIIRQCRQSKQPLPDRIANAPVLRQGLEFYLQAFFDLDSERNQGMGQGRIPWFSIQRYASFYALNEDERDRLNYYIRALDAALAKHYKEKHG